MCWPPRETTPRWVPASHANARWCAGRLRTDGPYGLRESCIRGRLTFDMSGGFKAAKPLWRRPLDRRVRRWSQTRPAVALYGRPAEAHATRQHPHVHEHECVQAQGPTSKQESRANCAAVRLRAAPGLQRRGRPRTPRRSAGKRTKRGQENCQATLRASGNKGRGRSAASAPMC